MVLSEGSMSSITVQMDIVGPLTKIIAVLMSNSTDISMAIRNRSIAKGPYQDLENHGFLVLLLEAEMVTYGAATAESEARSTQDILPCNLQVMFYLSTSFQVRKFCKN